MKNADLRRPGSPVCGLRIKPALRLLLCLPALMITGTPSEVRAQAAETEPALPGDAPPPPLPPDNSSILTDDRPAAARMVKEVDVRFRGTATVDRARVTSNMRLKPGELYTQEKEEDDLRALYNTGDFLNVEMEKVDVPGGMRIIVTVEARPAMGDLVFEGNTAFNSNRLEDELDFKAGGVVDDAKLTEAQAKILELYKKKGYPDVIVTYAVEPGTQPGFSRVVFRIDEGGRGIIHDVLFEGNSVFRAGKLRGITTSDNRNWLKFWDLKRKLDRTKIEQDIKAIQTFYGDHGYFDARVDGVDNRPAGKDRVDVVFRITEGPQYTTGGVDVAGNKIFETASLIPVFELEAGKTFSLKDMKADIETIEDFYGSRGYAEVKVTPRIDKRNGEIFVTYGIVEGGQFKVGKINVAGNQNTKTEVILREMDIDPGDDYNTIRIKRSMDRLQKLNYFGDEQNPAITGVDFMPVASDLGPDYKDLNISVQEKRTGQVQFGAGLSSVDSIVGMVEVTQSNFDLTNWPSFTGAGQRFRLSLRAGTERKEMLLSLTEPYFMGHRLSLGGDLFWTEKTFLSDRYDQREAGGAINLRKPLGDHTDLRLTYTLQNVSIYDVDDDATEEIKSQEGDYLQSRLSATVVRDTRDSFQLPRRGHKLSGEGAFSGGFLGGDVETYHVALTGAKHWEIPWDVILNLEGRIGVVDSFGGGDEVPIFEREFLGGAYNLRGFDYRDVGPKDSQGEPLGGGTSAYVTLEATFPIFSKVRGAVFMDAGFVNGGSWDFGTSDYNADVGIGIRVNLPILGPVKLDYGIPVNSDEFNDSSGRVSFGVDFKF